MIEHRFYQFSKTNLPLAVSKLAQTVATKGLIIGLYCEDEVKRKDISAALWRENLFLPHNDIDDGLSPILLSLTPIERADVAFVIDDGHIQNWDVNIICYLFHIVDQDIVVSRRKDWKNLKEEGAHITYWAEDDTGKWVKHAEENAPSQTA